MASRSPKSRNATTSSKWWQKLTAPQASVLVAVVALFSSGVAGIAAYLKGHEDAPVREVLSEEATGRLEALIVPRPGYRRLTYPRLGYGLLIPTSWQVDAAAYEFGGSDVDLIRHYDLDTNSISEGVKFVVRAVQGNYVNSPSLEEQNQLDVLRKTDANARLERASLAGRVAARFVYRQSTGKREAVVNRYWLRLASRAKLDVFVFTNLEGARPEFENEARDILASVAFDDETIRRNAQSISD